MPFQLETPFDPAFATEKPEETATELLVRLAKWNAQAKVVVTNEAGNRYKIGFVQVLYENVVDFTYANSVTTVSCGPLPVLDSPDATYSPWYWKPKAYSPVVVGAGGAVRATAIMRDSPQDPVPWVSAHDGSALQKARYRLKFKTWLVARNITALPYPNQFAAILFQFNTVIDLTFNIDTTKPLGQRCNFATIRDTDALTRCEKITPPSHIHSCVWEQRIANAQLAESHKNRSVVVNSTTPVGPVNTGVNVRSRINAAPQIIMGAPRTSAPTSGGGSSGGVGGFFRRLFHRRAAPPVNSDE
jgi:hypothetical protein